MIQIREFRSSSLGIAGRWLLSLIFLISAVQTVHNFHDTAADLEGEHVPFAGVVLGFAVTAELLALSPSSPAYGIAGERSFCCSFYYQLL